MNIDAMPRVVVLGWGNVTRSDDGLGPLLLERIRRAQFAHVTAIEDFQLQIEHALDLQGCSLALFVDAAAGAPPFHFTETAPRPDMAFSTHKLAPEAVLDVYERVLGQTPPPAFVLSVAGEDFSIGDTLSPAATQRLELASDFLLRLLQGPSLQTWREAAAKIAAAQSEPGPKAI